MNKLIVVGLLFLSLLVQGCVSSYSDNRTQPLVTHEAADWMAGLIACIDLGIEKGFLTTTEVDNLGTEMVQFARMAYIAGPSFKNHIEKYKTKFRNDSDEALHNACDQIRLKIPEYTVMYASWNQQIIQNRQNQIVANNRLNSSFNEAATNLGSEPLSMYNPNFNYNIGPAPVVNFGSPSINSNSPTNFLINTDSGLQQVRCRTLPNGFVYCD